MKFSKRVEADNVLVAQQPMNILQINIQHVVNLIENLLTPTVNVVDQAGNNVVEVNPIIPAVTQYMTDHPSSLLSQYCIHNEPTLRNLLLNNIRFQNLETLLIEISNTIPQNQEPNIYITNELQNAQAKACQISNAIGVFKFETYSFIARCAEQREAFINNNFILAPTQIVPRQPVIDSQLSFLKHLFSNTGTFFVDSLSNFLHARIGDNIVAPEVFGQTIFDFFVSLTPLIFAFSPVQFFLIDANLITANLVHFCLEVTARDTITVFSQNLPAFINAYYSPYLRQKLEDFVHTPILLNQNTREIVLVGYGFILAVVLGFAGLLKYSTVFKFIKTFQLFKLETFVNFIGVGVENSRGTIKNGVGKLGEFMVDVVKILAKTSNSKYNKDL